MKFFPFKFNLFISGAIAAYFCTVALLQLWTYHALNSQAPATILAWQTLPRSSAFAIEASYTFEAQGRTLTGQTIFSKPYHLNTFSAQQQIKKFTERQWVVWYEAKSPAHSSLERVFPLKKVVYAVMALGVFVYFVAVRAWASCRFR